MANYQSLKAAINAVIKANGNKEITGTVLNEVLLAMVNSLGAGYQFAGVATPDTTPGTPDQKVFYIASQAGTYTNFGGAVISNGIAIFKWNGTWTTETLDLHIPEQVQSDWTEDDTTKKSYIQHKPNIPEEQVQSDWTETDTAKKSYIKHKPNIPPSANVDPVPTNGSPNAVASGGVYNALKTITDFLNNGYYFVGIAGTSTVPDSVTQYGIFYIASDGGAYTNFLNGDDEPLTLYQGLNILYKDIEDDGWNYFEVFKFSDFVDTTQQQSLSTQQKAQARTNIAAVSYDAQTLNADQQVQAQNNMVGKAYAPAQFSGLGKKVLSKNMQSVGGVQKNVMTQAFFQDSQSQPLTNTIFVIQYDYTLTGNITLPAGSTLLFDGGSISGDGQQRTITCNATTIQAAPLHIFDNIVLAGTVTADLCLNNFVHSRDCVTSAKNVGRAIHVVGQCTIDEPMNVTTGFNIYGDDRYKTRIILSNSYSGAINTIFLFDSGNVAINYTSFHDFSVSNTDYVFYRHQSDVTVGGSFQVADFYNLLFNVRISAFHFYNYGFGCVNITNCYFMGDEATGALIDFYGYWFNNNTIEKCRCSGTNGGFLKIRTVPKGSNHGKSNQNKFIDNWLERITLRENVEYLVDIQSEYNLQVFTISENYFEQIKKSDSSYASLFKIMSENGAVRAVSFTKNFILGQYIVLHLNNNTNIDVSNNGPYVSDTYQTIKTNGILRVYNYNNASLLTFDAPTVYNCNLNSIPQLNLFSDRLHHCTFINKIIQAGATERISLMPDLGDKLPYWSDVQIIRGSLEGAGIIEGKIGQVGNSAKFFVTNQQDSVLTITPINNSTTVDITNTSEVSVEIRIGVIIMVYA